MANTLLVHCSVQGLFLLYGLYLLFQDNEIQENAANLIQDMVHVLNKVPREMLLIFKTNDCLRGIDSRLKTRFRANAFISMTKSCTQVVFEEKIKLSGSWVGQLLLKMQRTLAMLAIEFTQLTLQYFSHKGTQS